MRVIIAGSRSIEDYALVKRAISKCRFEITEVVSGGARGADLLGERWAKENGIPIRQFIPDWEGLGKKAGIMRNEQMAEYADALVAVWDGDSRGTMNMISRMADADKPYYVINTFVDAVMENNRKREEGT